MNRARGLLPVFAVVALGVLLGFGLARIVDIGERLEVAEEDRDALATALDDVRAQVRRSNEVPVSPPSEQVIEGERGDAGPQGPAGPAGSDGDDGTDGAPGPPGATGPAGVDGTQGEPGPAGPQGEPGPAGVDGADGIDGTDGTAGADGAPGADGATGPPGPPCPDGYAAEDRAAPLPSRETWLVCVKAEP